MTQLTCLKESRPSRGRLPWKAQAPRREPRLRIASWPRRVLTVLVAMRSSPESVHGRSLPQMPNGAAPADSRGARHVRREPPPRWIMANQHTPASSLPPTFRFLFLVACSENFSTCMMINSRSHRLDVVSQVFGLLRKHILVRVPVGYASWL
jgi:hypothetical protein